MMDLAATRIASILTKQQQEPTHSLTSLQVTHCPRSPTCVCPSDRASLQHAHTIKGEMETVSVE
jgi:hypothetical protein